MMDEIVTIPNPILKQKAKPIKEITPEIRNLADRMIDFMDGHSKDKPIPIGLSACQLGYSLRMIAFRRNPQILERNDIIILINPELVSGKGKRIVNEGCLSIPGEFYQLKRFKIAKIRGLTLDGDVRSFRGHDLLGQIFQHELDHLDGILVSDTVKIKISAAY